MSTKEGWEEKWERTPLKKRRIFVTLQKTLWAFSPRGFFYMFELSSWFKPVLRIFSKIHLILLMLFLITIAISKKSGTVFCWYKIIHSYRTFDNIVCHLCFILADTPQGASSGTLNVFFLLKTILYSWQILSDFFLCCVKVSRKIFLKI